MKTPEILYGAIRQYRHNRGNDELVMGFDSDETIKAVTKLQAEIQRLRDLLAKSIRREEIIEAELKVARAALIDIRDNLIVELKAENWDTGNEDYMIEQVLGGSEEGGVCEYCGGNGMITHGDPSEAIECGECNGTGRLVQEEES